MGLTGRNFLQKFVHLKKRAPFCNVRCQTTLALIQDTSEELVNAKSFDEIPSDFSLPIIGTTWTYFPYIGKYDTQKMHEASIAKYKKFGPIVRENLMGSYKAVSLYDPADIEKVFRHEGKYPSRPGMEFISAYRSMRPEWYKSPGLVGLSGKEWQEFRSKFQHSTMVSHNVHKYLEVMEEVAEDTIDRMKTIRDENGEIPNFDLELCKWSLETLTMVALGRRLSFLDKHSSPNSKSVKLIEAAVETIESINHLRFQPFNLWKYIPTRSWRRFVKSQDSFASLAIEEVKCAMKHIAKNAEEKEKPNLIQCLLTSQNNDSKDVVTFVMDAMLAGIDTTSHSVAFALYLLAKNPKCQEKAFTEISLNVPKNEPLTTKNLNQLTYVKACIKEAMRIFPTVSGTVRMLDHDIVLSGYKIPAGVVIMFQNLAACRQENYFPRADEYIPERWLMDQKRHHPFLILPFGFGKRMCVGKRIADQEILLILIKILQNFRMEYHHEDISCCTRLVNVPNKPLRIKFIDRNN